VSALSLPALRLWTAPAATAALNKMNGGKVAAGAVQSRRAGKRTHVILSEAKDLTEIFCFCL